MKSTVLNCALLATLLTSCALGPQKTTETESVEGSKRNTAIALHGNPAAAALETARQQMRDGEFAAASATLELIPDAADADPEQKAAALLELGRINVDVLNPRRDPELARQYFQRLVDEHPSSELVPRAREQLGRLASTKD